MFPTTRAALKKYEKRKRKWLHTLFEKKFKLSRPISSSLFSTSTRSFITNPLVHIDKATYHLPKLVISWPTVRYQSCIVKGKFIRNLRFANHQLIDIYQATTTMVTPSLQTSFLSASSSSSSSSRRGGGGFRPPLSPSATSSVQVVVRVRPLNDREKNHGTLPVISASTSDKTVTVIKGSGSRQVKSSYKFDNVFTSFSTQEDIFEATLQPIIRDVLNGYESTVFAYGQVGRRAVVLLLCAEWVFWTNRVNDIKIFIYNVLFNL
jgi:hypothetical protein